MQDSGRPVLIGYWKGYGEPDLPDPRDFVDASWDAYERHEVAKFLSNGTVVVEYRGLSSCRFCGHGTGHREFTDGTYQWPEGLAHYLWVHQVRLPAAVVTHIKSRLVGFEDNGSDLEWWRTAHIDPRAAALTPPYTAMESYRSTLGRGSTTSTPETAEGAARVRLESAMWDWYSQQQSTSVILEKAYRLRWALEDAMQLSAVTDEEADHYRDILKTAPPLGELKFRDTDDERPDGTARTT